MQKYIQLNSYLKSQFKNCDDILIEKKNLRTLNMYFFAHLVAGRNNLVEIT